MEANLFVANLKADGSKNDLIDLVEARKQYDEILAKIASKDRAPFALNVLCILCRNIEKVPSWCEAVDTRLLLSLSVECVRETLKGDCEQVKTLACIYHIHRYAVRQKSAPPKIVLELSYIAFHNKMLKDYFKTYWNIIGDRITYIEKIKACKDVTKLYPKLIEDVLRIIEMSDIKFCLTILSFTMKKLHYLYSDSIAVDLNEDYRRIFNVISQKNDLKNLKKMTYKDLIDVYMKLNDCLYIVAENASINKFKSSALNNVVQTCISLVGHCPDLLYCLQNVYLNCFCSILTENPNLPYMETIFTNLVSTCETSERLGYTKAMNITYPYVNQFLKLYIEYNVVKDSRNDNKQLTESIQISCLTLIEYLLKKLKHCNQILKCDNCQVKTGLHDGLRLSLLTKDLISSSIKQETSLENILPAYFTLVLQQYEILKDLCVMGCANYQKCYKKLQSDVHNTAILLNKSQNYQYSIKLFEIYLTNEVKHFKNKQDLKNISRALYNKSICELDSKMYETALQDAYLSFAFACPEGLSSDKHMSLAMDIKAKELKSRGDDEDSSLQTVTVFGACSQAVTHEIYGSLKPFFCNLRFSELLEHEYKLYAKLWPSIGPIAAVCEALLNLAMEQPSWIVAKDDQVESRLYRIVLEAPSVVRTIHNEVYARVVNALVDQFGNYTPTTTEQKIVLAAMLFLKAEFDMAEASRRYGWKSVVKDPDSEAIQSSGTFAQEYEAIKHALTGVQLWADIVDNLDSANLPSNLRPALQIAQVIAQLLSHLSCTAHAMQLATSCCEAAKILGDTECALFNEATAVRLGAPAGGGAEHPAMSLHTAAGLMHAAATAIHYNDMGASGVAAKLVQAVQARIINAYSKAPDDSLELPVGYLLDAIAAVCGPRARAEAGAAPGALTAVTAPPRHYLSITTTGRAWCCTRLRRLATRAAGAQAALAATQTWSRLGVYARARSCAALPAPPAAPRARLAAALAPPHRTELAQIKIDNCLKYTLGIPASADRPSHQEPDDIIPRLNPAWPPGPTPGLAVRTAGLEAATYFRSKQFENATKYYKIAFQSIPQAEAYIKNSLERYKFDKNVLKVAQSESMKDLRIAELEMLIEAAYFGLSQENYQSTDEYLVRIHEILEEDKQICCYIKSDVLNLMTTSAYLRKRKTKKLNIDNLEAEFDSLRLSPAKNFGVPKTPDAKAEIPSKITKIKVKDEEIPKTKRRVIKLNLDENGDEKLTTTKRTNNKDFKFPGPVLSKPVLEVIPPTPKRNPDIVISEPSNSILDFATPKPDKKAEFFTPIATPSEQFFTPMSTLKTYTKKSLRQGLVKNLENEFSTPKSELKKPETNTIIDKENLKNNGSLLPQGVMKSRDKKNLKRATSPGKLEKRETRIPTRATRLRQPVRLSVDEEETK